MKREKITTLRFSIREYELLKTEAERRGLNISSLIRVILYKNQILKKESDLDEKKD